MKVTFVVNPVAGRGRSRGTWEEIERVLRDQGREFEVYHTERPGHAWELASRLKGSCDVLVSVGGDGTLHEIVNGLMESGWRPTLGIVPSGTGNDFVKTASLPLDPVAAARLIWTARPRPVDLGLVTSEEGSRYFVNVSGAGFDAEVARRVNKGIRFLTGTAAYLAAVVEELLGYRAFGARLTLDGGETVEGTVFLAAVGNARYYGGGMMMVPTANIDDGLLDLCVVGDIGLADIVTTLPKLFTGRHIHHPKVSMYRSRTVRIDSARGMAVHADGEIIAVLPATFMVLPGAVSVIGAAGGCCSPGEGKTPGRPS